ncbi:MAG: aromatic ring-hydroxylating oxygenase subunit alpha [Burkholderiales bacterium]
MNDAARTPSLLTTPPPLPVNWYFDTAILAAEEQALFAQGPRYAGHELMVPNAGDYQVLPWDERLALMRSEGGIELLSNVCRHRQSLLLKGKGSTKNIVCPLHHWTYALDGNLLGAPLFPNNPNFNLERFPLKSWNGLLFRGDRDVAKDLTKLGAKKEFDFEGYVLDAIETEIYPFNWKTFLEVYLELYHVTFCHPGLSQFVDPENFCWEFGERYSVQYMGVYKELAKPGNPTYAKLHEEVLRAYEGKQPPYGTLWMIYYPNVMLEWYPQSLVISTLYPRGIGACLNVVEFYYPEEIALFEREFVEAHRAAYLESAHEDGGICAHMHEGRAALYRSGASDAAPYLSPHEDGMAHFHNYLRREIEPYLEQD